MSKYQCEGFIKEVKVPIADPKDKSKISFKLEPAAPYLFEQKVDDGKTMKNLLFIADSKTPKSGRIINVDSDFSTPAEYYLEAILIAKGNRLKVRVTSNLKLDKQSKFKPYPISVDELTVL